MCSGVSTGPWSERPFRALLVDIPHSDGLGALIFSPISEIESIGRNAPYITSFALFVVVSGLAAASKSFPALVVIRFIQGFLGSPALATGAASMQDMASCAIDADMNGTDGVWLHSFAPNIYRLLSWGGWELQRVDPLWDQLSRYSACRPRGS